MKRIISVFLAVLMTFSLCACGDTKENEKKDNNEAEVTEAGNVPKMDTVLNSGEYLLYTNIFYNKTADDYVGNTFEKEGIFTRLRDSYNKTERYYVWGYNDNTKCCDWQWELVPADEGSLPPVGSLVKVSGTFTKSDAALDGYWITDATVTVEKEYKMPECDIPMTTMGGTLERVQIINIQNFPEDYEGLDIYAYGRIASLDGFEDPYYNGSWSQRFQSSDTLPSIGTMTIIHGVCRSGVISDSTLRPTENY